MSAELAPGVTAPAAPPAGEGAPPAPAAASNGAQPQAPQPNAPDVSGGRDPDGGNRFNQRIQQLVAERNEERQARGLLQQEIAALKERIEGLSGTSQTLDQIRDVFAPPEAKKPQYVDEVDRALHEDVKPALTEYNKRLDAIQARQTEMLEAQALARQNAELAQAVQRFPLPSYLVDRALRLKELADAQVKAGTPNARQVSVEGAVRYVYEKEYLPDVTAREHAAVTRAKTPPNLLEAKPVPLPDGKQHRSVRDATRALFAGQK